MELKHSGPGIASFITSILGAVLIFATFIAAGAIETTTPGGVDEESPIAIVIGFAIIGLVLAQIIAFVLGIVGLFQQERKKLFPILGTVFSGLFILGTVALVAFGMMLSQVEGY
ncbi:MAG: hypothetical protein AAFX93_06695 [Verrucomicrobiota bacterium]